ncbi:MAG: DMT family transporter [Gemmatimonadales bacterium]|nr:DMT family transporter [Gemmatimonadales bacterium]MDQ3427422.1 DMT family transporter [Gemmatimonadota bacterium]
MTGLVVLALLVGVLLPLQTGINAQLRLTLGAPLAAALVSFLVGTAGLVVLAMITGVSLPVLAAWGRSPWWHWIGGLLGAVYVASVIVLAPRLGAATLIAAVVAGQMLASLVVDHYGWVGFAAHPATGVRILGAALIIAGVVLVQR